MQLMVRWALHILPRALVFSSRLDLTWVLLHERSLNRVPRSDTQKKVELAVEGPGISAASVGFWRMFEGILGGESAIGADLR